MSTLQQLVTKYCEELSDMRVSVAYLHEELQCIKSNLKVTNPQPVQCDHALRPWTILTHVTLAQVPAQLPLPIFGHWEAINIKCPIPIIHSKMD